MLAGYTYSFGSGTPGSSNTYIIKMDNSGNLLWERVYGDTDDGGFSGTECSDKGFIFAGISKHDFYLLKTDSTGNIGVEEEQSLKSKEQKLAVFPNPAYGWVDIKCEIPYSYSKRGEESIQIVIYDVAGRIADKVFHKGDVPGSYIIRYATTNLVPGIYFVSLVLNKSSPYLHKQKLIILK